MITESYDFARGAGNTDTGGTSTAYLFAPLDWRVTLNRLSAASTLTQQQVEQGAVSTITAELSSGGVVVTQTVDVTGDRADRTFSLGINVTAGNSVRLQIYTHNSRFYYDNEFKYLAGGWTGSGWTPQSVGWYDCTMSIAYTPMLTIDGQNDGYAYPTGTDPTPFTEFERDKNGYPKNFGVWKLDGQNDGYPWPVGYVPIRQNGDIVKIMQNGAWRDTAGCKVFTNGGAQDAFLKIKSSPPME